MNKETYQKIGVFFPILVGGAFTLGLITDNFVYPLLVLIIGIPLIFLAKSKVKDVIEDERDYKIGGYAGRYAMAIYSVAASILGLVFLARNNPVAEAVAYTLFVTVSTLLLLYIILFAYFEKKM